MVNLDSSALIGVVIWGNIAMGIIVCLYEATSKYKLDSGFFTRHMALVRFLSAIGYLCLFMRNNIPIFVSANIGNSLLYVCQYFDCCILLEIANLRNKKILIIETVIMVSSIIIFNLLEILFGSASLRIGIASIIIFCIFTPPAIMLMVSKQASKFKRSIGVFYIPLLCGLIPRSIEGFVGKIISIKANTYYQTMLFGSIMLLMISNTIIYLLFIKEKSDSIIEKMANYDNLTNVLNRHSFFSTGNAVFETHKTHKSVLSLLFLDIDHFKKINDRYGHQFGDEVLVRFSNTIKTTIRPSDICCRYGGEEFIVLTNANEEGCKAIAVRILRETENIAFDSKVDFHMTTSIGCIAGIPEAHETLESYINKADKALYRAKNEGRNRIIFYDV